jgi:lipopolysaccharide export system protein LptA
VKLLQKTKNILWMFALFFFLENGYSSTINFKADSMNGSINETNSFTELKGNSWIKNEDIELSADKITLSGDNYQFIVAEGNIKGTSIESGFSFSCESLEFNQETGIIVLKENVSLEDKANEILAKANIIEYDQNTEIATMQINVEITHKDSLCKATLAIYKKTLKMLDLSGNPEITRDSDLFSAQEITLNMETEEITLDGKVRGSVIEKKTEA